VEAEHAAVRAGVKTVRKEGARVLARRHQAGGGVREDSHKSRKPRSTDGPTCKTGSQGIKRGREAGGQGGHPGRTLWLVEQRGEVCPPRRGAGQPSRCRHTTSAASSLGVVLWKVPPSGESLSCGARSTPLYWALEWRNPLREARSFFSGRAVWSTKTFPERSRYGPASKDFLLQALCRVGL
jgi:hypothetical protein